MESLHCSALLASVELGSLTAAAQQLGYTQSGISRMIQTLEQELGFPLLIRAKRGVLLTENGKAMLPLLRDVVHAQQNVLQRSAEIHGVIRGTLRIGCYYSMSALWMPAVLQQFCARYPGIHVQMQEGGNLELGRWLREKSVDCCFGAKPKQPGCDWIPIFRDELLVWLPPGHRFAECRAFPLAQLECEPFIHTAPAHDTDQDRLLADHALHPQTRFSTRDAFTTYNMVEAGLGVSFNQRLISQKWQGRVVQLPFDPPQYVPLGIALAPEQARTPAVRCFVDCVRQLLQHASDEEGPDARVL